MQVIISLTLILGLLITTEFLWRRRRLDPEAARKWIHIVAGSFIAFWPLYMSWQTIQLLSIALFVGVLVSYEFGVFGAIHKVKRRTSGELWFPVGIGLCALATNQPWIFAVAILHLSLADGLAAVVGTKWGRSSRYRIGTHTKSLIGSFVFLIVSSGLCAFAYLVLQNELPGMSIAVFALTPLLATTVENMSRHGLDNVFVPLSVVFALGLPTGTLMLNL